MFEKLKSLFGSKSANFDLLNEDSGVGIYPLQNSARSIAELNREDYLRLYQSWVYLCVSTISDSISELDFVLKKGDRKIDDPQLALITPDFLRKTVSQLLLTGSAYFWMNRVGRKVDSLELLRSDCVELEENEDGYLKWYRYDWGRKQYAFSKDEIIDFSLFNPIETYPYTLKGVSPVQAVAIQAEIDRVANRWNWNFFRNGASVGSMLMTDQQISEENKRILVSKWKSQFQGVNNSHSVAILDNGLKYAPIPTSKREMDFVESKRFTRDEILAIFKIPPSVVGITDNANRASAQVALETFYRVCISPLASQIAEVLSQNLFPGVGKIEFVNIVPVDAELVRMDFDAGAITVNEYRISRWYSPIQGGDVIPALKTEAVAPKSAFRKSVEKSVAKHFPGTPEYKADREADGLKAWQAKIARTNPYEERFQKVVKEIFEDQKSDVISSLKKKSTNKAFEFKIDKLKWRMMWYRLTSIYRDIMQSEGTLSLEQVGVSSIFQVGNPSINRFVNESIRLLSKSADDFTISMIEDVIKEWNDQGYGVDKIANMISWMFEDFTPERSLRIARTEITTASTKATVDAWKQSGVVESKEWYTAPDERVCKQCGAMHRKVAKLNDDFFKKGDSFEGVSLDYRDIDWPSLHPNCRCTLLPVLK